MELYELPYGDTVQIVSLPEDLSPTLVLPQETPAAPDPVLAVANALAHPLNFDWGLVQPDHRVAITVNDKTRPVPNHLLLPPLLEKLEQSGVSRENIILWIATGSHPPMPPEEFSRVLPLSIIDRYTIRSHEVDNTNNLILLGTTRRGTPIWVNRTFFQADVKIVVGDIEPHHFAGFSGGYKSAAIGMAGRATINANHKLLTDANAWIGVYQDNPLRQDIEEIGAAIGVHLALNAVLNQKKEIVEVFCGHPKNVIAQAIPRVLDICAIDQEGKFDLVIASAGGQPKDINFYQAQKALTHASMFCQPGGTILLAAACPEGTGNRAYEEFMAQANSLEDVFRLFAQQEFRVGPHKAYQVGRLLRNYHIVLISSIPDHLVRRLLMQPAGSVQQAVNQYLSDYPGAPKIAILPHATTTLAR